MTTPKPEKEETRRICPDCGGYMFKSVAGVWRHWAYWPDTDHPVECPEQRTSSEGKNSND